MLQYTNRGLGFVDSRLRNLKKSRSLPHQGHWESMASVSTSLGDSNGGRPGLLGAVG